MDQTTPTFGHGHPAPYQEPDLTQLGALIADRSRARILVALLDGRAQTAKELALRAGVSAATASEHLARLERAGLLGRERQGRNHYFRLAGDEVARFLEAAFAIAQTVAVRPLRTGPTDRATMFARCCWDHLAGVLGVALADRLAACGDLTRREERFAVADSPVLLPLLLDAPWPDGKVCLDWSVRRPHIGGALGRALFGSLLTRGWMVRTSRERAVALTDVGRRALASLVGVVELEEAGAMVAGDAGPARAPVRYQRS
jgi:DNA-binding transcriptional ArsR family regulator